MNDLKTTYYVRYWSATPNRRMLGGVVRSQSSRFSHEEDARNYLQAVIRTHARLDSPMVVDGEVLESQREAEILRHCTTPTAINCRCPECGVWVRRQG